MAIAAEARRDTPPSVKFKQTKRLSRFCNNRRKPLYQAVFSTSESGRRAKAAAWHCIKDGSFIDLGCGTGLELEYYFAINPDAHVTGIDMSRGMLDALRAKFPDRSIDLICGSYFDVDMGRGRYDAVVSVESLHHFTGERKLPLYRSAMNALRPGGIFVLTDYFAESDAEERAFFDELARLQAEQGLNAECGYYHYDTPLTVEHEMAVIRAAGFSDAAISMQWGATHTLIARA